MLNIKKHLLLLTLLVSLFLFISSMVFWINRFSTNITQANDLELIEKKPSNYSLPSYIKIGQLIESYILVSDLLDKQDSVAKDKPTYLNLSARPQEGGNIIIYGHNSNNVFKKLQLVKLDDTIELTTEDGIQHTYQVSHIKEVALDQTEYIQPTSFELLTLYTCSGWLDSKRLVIQALPIEKNQDIKIDSLQVWETVLNLNKPFYIK